MQKRRRNGSGLVGTRMGLIHEWLKTNGPHKTADIRKGILAQNNPLMTERTSVNSMLRCLLRNGHVEIRVPGRDSTKHVWGIVEKKPEANKPLGDERARIAVLARMVEGLTVAVQATAVRLDKTQSEVLAYRSQQEVRVSELETLLDKRAIAGNDRATRIEALTKRFDAIEQNIEALQNDFEVSRKIEKAYDRLPKSNEINPSSSS